MGCIFASGCSSSSWASFGRKSRFVPLGTVPNLVDSMAALAALYIPFCRSQIKETQSDLEFRMMKQNPVFQSRPVHGPHRRFAADWSFVVIFALGWHSSCVRGDWLCCSSSFSSFSSSSSCAHIPVPPHLVPLHLVPPHLVPALPCRYPPSESKHHAIPIILGADRITNHLT